MIDPKLNAIPAQQPGASKGSGAGGTGKNKEAAEQLRKVSAGLSVNDTIASNANMSVGGQGVDTSGVSAGAGVGQGMTRLDSKPSSVTEIMPGARGSGTTPLGSSDIQSPGANFPSESGVADSDIAAEAYQAWCDRGCPIGSPEVDWETAVSRLRNRQAKGAGA